MDCGYTLLRRGVLSATAGTGDQSAPGNAATITIWSSDNTLTDTRRGVRFKRLVLNLYSSHASGTDGVIFEESSDDSNWRTLVTYTLAATTYTKYIVAPSAPYVRVRYTNSANALTTWEMTLLGDTHERAGTN